MDLPAKSQLLSKRIEVDRNTVLDPARGILDPQRSARYAEVGDGRYRKVRRIEQGKIVRMQVYRPLTVGQRNKRRRAACAFQQQRAVYLNFANGHADEAVELGSCGKGCE